MRCLLSSHSQRHKIYQIEHFIAPLLSFDKIIKHYLFTDNNEVCLRNLKLSCVYISLLLSIAVTYHARLVYVGNYIHHSHYIYIYITSNIFFWANLNNLLNNVCRYNWDSLPGATDMSNRDIGLFMFVQV